MFSEEPKQFFYGIHYEYFLFRIPFFNTLVEKVFFF